MEQGKAYYAFDTAAELDAKRQAAKAEGKAYRYDRTTMANLPKETVQAWLKEGRPAVIRFKTPEGPITIKDEILGEATLPAGEVDDFVIRKADGFPTYHFAVVVDDELMGVTHVLRAQEHFNNTAKHMVLQDALGFRRPVYGHLPIICNPDGSKMSKRDKDKVLRKAVQERALAAPPEGTVSAERFKAWLADKNTQLELEEANAMADALQVALPEINVDDFRRSGYLPSVVCNFLALNGWSPGENLEKFDNAFLAQRFDLKRVVKTPAKFDRVKLLSFNCDAIVGMPREEFVRLAEEHGKQYHPAFMAKLTPAQFRLLADASHERSKTLDDMFKSNRFFTVADDAVVYEPKSAAKALQGGTPSGMDHVKALLAELQGVQDWNAGTLENCIKGYADRTAGGALGKVAQPLRVAVSGGTVSPPIFDVLRSGHGSERSGCMCAHCNSGLCDFRGQGGGAHFLLHQESSFHCRQREQASTEQGHAHAGSAGHHAAHAQVHASRSACGVQRLCGRRAWGMCGLCRAVVWRFHGRGLYACIGRPRWFAILLACLLDRWRSWLARLHDTEEVTGSSPVRSTGWVESPCKMVHVPRGSG